MQASDGKLYVSEQGGGPQQHGAISRMRLDGSDFTTLHIFSWLDGASPGRLLEVSDGLLYGTGGDTLFRMNASGSFETIYDFSSNGDACCLSDPLIQAADGYLYATSPAGGTAYGGGTAVRIGLDGTEAVLHSFRGVEGDGAGANGPLVEGPDGLLYGTTGGGGLYRGGSIFRVDPSKTIPVLSVTPPSGPAVPYAQVEITGAGFQPGATAWIGTQPLLNPVVVSSSLIQAQTSFLSPGFLHHVAVKNPDGTEGSLAGAFFAEFEDVPEDDIFRNSVEKMVRDGISSGCGAGNYCRDFAVVRAQISVYLLKALYGRGFVPPFATGTLFGDVSIYDSTAPWIEELAHRGITAGCGSGNFCPGGVVTRAQVAVFLLKALLGIGYEPPAPTGTVFEDVAVDSFAAAWIEDLARRGITGGCSASPPRYCPESAITQGQMAALLVKTFGLP